MAHLEVILLGLDSKLILVCFYGSLWWYFLVVYGSFCGVALAGNGMDCNAKLPFVSIAFPTVA